MVAFWGKTEDLQNDIGTIAMAQLPNERDRAAGEVRRLRDQANSLDRIGLLLASLFEYMRNVTNAPGVTGPIALTRKVIEKSATEAKVTVDRIADEFRKQASAIEAASDEELSACVLSGQATAIAGISGLPTAFACLGKACEWVDKILPPDALESLAGRVNILRQLVELGAWPSLDQLIAACFARETESSTAATRLGIMAKLAEKGDWERLAALAETSGAQDGGEET
jgi:hypothetical protein